MPDRTVRDAALLFPDLSLAGTQLGPASLSISEQALLDEAIIATRPWKPYADLLREGATTDRLYVMLEGWAFRYKTTRAGGRQIVGLALPGEVANLDAVMFERPGFGVTMLTEAKIVELDCDTVLSLAAHHPGVGHLLTRLAIVENRILSQWALNLGRLQADARLAHLLCELLVRVHAAPADRLDLCMTQEQLADTLGLTAVHVNRMLQVLRQRGLIVTNGRTITAPDLPSLWDMAEFDPGYLQVEFARSARRPAADPNHPRAPAP